MVVALSLCRPVSVKLALPFTFTNGLTCRVLQKQRSRRCCCGTAAVTAKNDLVFSPPSKSWNPTLIDKLTQSFRLYKEFITEDEEDKLFKEVEPHLKRMVYEKDHWDDAIVGFRETERKKWNESNMAVIKRLREVSFSAECRQLPYVHVLDLAEEGHIKPHIDSPRFCGDTVAVLSLLSDCVLRMVHDKEKEYHVDCLVPKRSLYIMSGSSRYDYTHEILPNEMSLFDGRPVKKGRRISIVCRNDTDVKNKKSN